jgi:hypothetical protein
MEEKENNDLYRERKRRYHRGFYPGVWLVIIGIIFLLKNFGYLQGEVWGKLWPLFLIVPGLLILFRSKQ